MAEGAQARGRPRWRAPAALAALLLGLAGCAQDPTKDTEAAMVRLLAVLPGTYDNSTQVEQEARSGAQLAHVAVALTITHVYAPRLGHYVYYAQETAVDDPRRVLSQKMYSFQFDDKRGIVETLYQLVEPLRWRDGQLHKELFTSLVTEDVQPEGCQLLWKHKDTGFVATHDPKACPDAGSAGVLPQVELMGSMLTIGVYKFHKVR